MGETVSCLCVSRPQRYGQLQRAILDFAAQTYQDRELVVVVDGQTDYANATQAFVDQLRRPDSAPAISVLSRNARSQTDGLTYAAVHARGSILCLWDVDYLNHPDRLAYQVDAQQTFRTAVTVLTEGLYFFHKDKELFAVSPGRPGETAAHRTLPSTMMAYRQFWPVMDPSTRGRPSEAMINNTARAGRKLIPIGGTDRPFLHVVGVTYDHLRTYEYHRNLAQTQGRPAEWLNARRTQLAAALDGYRWDGPVSVEGVDAGAFEYAPAEKWPDDLYPVKVDPDPQPERPTRPTPQGPAPHPPGNT